MKLPTENQLFDCRDTQQHDFQEVGTTEFGDIKQKCRHCDQESVVVSVKMATAQPQSKAP